MEHLTPIAVGLACLVVLGAAAASMDGAVQTDPADVVNSDLLSFPFEEETAAAAGELRADIEDELEDAREREPGDERDGDVDEGEHEEPGDPGESTSDEPPDESETGGRDGEPDEEGDQEATTPTAEDDPIAAFLTWLRSLLPTILPLLFVIVAAAAAVRALPATELVAAVRRRFPWAFTRSRQFTAEGMATSPENPIEVLWLEMLTGLGLDVTDRPDYTTQEWAHAAVDSGANPDDVAVLTGILEEVRFAGAPITDDRIEDARAARSRIVAQRERS